jgi:hypothetical protein
VISTITTQHLCVADRIERMKVSAVSRTTLPLWCFLKIHIGLPTVYTSSNIINE